MKLTATKQLAVLDREPVVMRTQRRLREQGDCLPSLDEIAVRLYVDINEINWILVMCSKCDTVMQTYELSLKAKPLPIYFTEKMPQA